ncbi:MAG: hypothetical protein IPM70_18730 [Proteobacteria bacterium]|nr:hypothetical protein [Pseudomonadota bacterium]
MATEAVPAEGVAGADAAPAAGATPVRTPRVFGDDAPEALPPREACRAGSATCPPAAAPPCCRRRRLLMNSMMHDVAMRHRCAAHDGTGRDDRPARPAPTASATWRFNGFNGRIVAQRGWATR